MCIMGKIRACLCGKFNLVFNYLAGNFAAFYSTRYGSFQLCVITVWNKIIAFWVKNSPTFEQNCPLHYEMEQEKEIN